MLDWKLVKLLDNISDDLLIPHSREVQKHMGDKRREEVEAQSAEWEKDFKKGFPKLRAEVEKAFNRNQEWASLDFAKNNILKYIWLRVLPTDIIIQHKGFTGGVLKIAQELADKLYRG